jgi:hypothetical protein
LDACQKGLSIGFITAAALVDELIEARGEKRLLQVDRRAARPVGLSRQHPRNERGQL